MKLSKALKLKNRLAGEVNRLQTILRRENSRRNDNVATVQCGEVYTQLTETTKELGELKGKIAQANVPIYPKLEKMAEIKAHIGFLQALPKRQGEEIVAYGEQTKTYQWEAFITQDDCDDLVVKLESEIAELQDQVDDFNATTELE